MKLTYRKDIEGLRALAILLVVAAHAKLPYLSGGFIGVDIFFVLSGYLITGLLLKELSNTGEISYLDFYHRRVKRLLPALVVMVVVVSAASMILLAPLEQAKQADSARFSALWLSNFYFAFAEIGYFDPSSETNLFLHTWSLGVEEQFYLIWPFLLILIAKGGLEKFANKLVLVLVLGFVLSIALFVFNPTWAFYLMPSRAWQFAAGGLVYVFSTRLSNTKISLLGHTIDRRLLGCGGLVLIVLAVGVVKKTTYPSFWALLPTAGACLILIGNANTAESISGLTRILSTPVLQWFGKISYSWYLWHWPVLVLGIIVLDEPGVGQISLLVLVSLILAVLSYHLVESPIRFSKFISRKPDITIAVSIALCGMLFAAAVKWYSATETWATSPEQGVYLKARRDIAKIYHDGCDDLNRSVTLDLCGYGSSEAQNTVVLLGDSIGAQWFPALEKFYLGNDWNIIVLTKSSCPIIDEDFYYDRLGRNYTECAIWRNAALQWIADSNPEALIMGSNQVLYSEAQWTGGTARVLDKIVDSVRDIYILMPTYTLPFKGPLCQSRWQWQKQFMTPVKDCASKPNTNYVDKIESWITSVAVDYENVGVINMNPFLCPDGVCYAEQDGFVQFRDNQHITATFARSLSSQFGMQVHLDPGQ